MSLITHFPQVNFLITKKNEHLQVKQLSILLAYCNRDSQYMLFCFYGLHSECLLPLTRYQKKDEARMISSIMIISVEYIHIKTEQHIEFLSRCKTIYFFV